MVVAVVVVVVGRRGRKREKGARRTAVTTDAPSYHHRFLSRNIHRREGQLLRLLLFLLRSSRRLHCRGGGFGRGGRFFDVFVRDVFLDFLWCVRRGWGMGGVGASDL